MTSILGPAPILDFDGTIADLPVDWSALRVRLGISIIDDLWARRSLAAFAPVTDAEVAAAVVADPVAATLRELEPALGFAVLSSNSALSIETFLARFPALAERTRLIVGRERLGGPKRDPTLFAQAFRACLEATATERGGAPVVYVGDMAFELELAAGLGAIALDVADLPA